MRKRKSGEDVKEEEDEGGREGQRRSEEVED